MHLLDGPTIRLTIITAAASMLVAACGGSGSSSEPIAKERINGIEVPPAPDPVANAATLAGVDVDGNGLRDDIDRLLAMEFGTDTAAHVVAKRFSITEQAAIVRPSASTAAAHLLELECISDRAILLKLSKVTRAALSTSARARAYGAAFAGATIKARECV
jgi:hypothetical protein